MMAALASRLGAQRWRRLRLLAMLAPFWLALCAGAIGRWWPPLFIGALGCVVVLAGYLLAVRRAEPDCHAWEETDDA